VAPASGRRDPASGAERGVARSEVRWDRFGWGGGRNQGREPTGKLAPSGKDTTTPSRERFGIEWSGLDVVALEGLELEPMLGAFATVSVAGSPEERSLNAAAHLMRTYGLKRWSMEDVAEHAAIGRTSVYRAFSTRDELVHAVLARELRSAIGEINAAAAASDSVEDGIIEGALAGLAVFRGSLVEQLLRTDPSTILPFLTTKAGQLIAITRQALAAEASAAGADLDPRHAEELAEIAARLGLSFILTRDTVFPVEDDEALRASMRRVLRPSWPRSSRRPAAGG
jgi:TetR/AcrR family transcriptional regulator, repressor for uid operon